MRAIPPQFASLLVATVCLAAAWHTWVWLSLAVDARPADGSTLAVELDWRKCPMVIMTTNSTSSFGRRAHYERVMASIGAAPDVLIMPRNPEWLASLNIIQSYLRAYRHLEAKAAARSAAGLPECPANFVFDDDVETAIGFWAARLDAQWAELAALGTSSYDIALFGGNIPPSPRGRRVSRYWVESRFLGLHAQALTADGLRKALLFGERIAASLARQARLAQQPGRPAPGHVHWDVLLTTASGLRGLVAAPFAFDQDRRFISGNRDWCGRTGSLSFSAAGRQVAHARLNCWTLRWKLNVVASWLVFLAPSYVPCALLAAAALLVGCANLLAASRCGRRVVATAGEAEGLLAPRPPYRYQSAAGARAPVQSSPHAARHRRCGSV